MLILILLINCSVKQKLIASNTFDPFDNIMLKKDVGDLTLWLQLRFKIIKIFSYDYKMLPIFKIADKYDNEQINSKIEFYQNHINLVFYVQQSSDKSYQVIIEEKQEMQWIHFFIKKNGCYNQILGPQSFLVESQCIQAFDQILFLNQIQICQLQFYDDQRELGMLETEIRQIYNFPQQKEYFYIINSQRNCIQVLAYVQFLNITNQSLSIFKLLNNEFHIIIQFKENNLLIYLEQYNKDQIKVSDLHISINEQQWMLIDVQFIKDIILLQFHMNGQSINTIINLELYEVYLRGYEKSLYQFQQLFQIINQNVIFDKLLLISNLNSNQKSDQDFCYSSCQKCRGFKCEDQIPKSCYNEEYFNFSSQQCQSILDSNFYYLVQQQAIKSCDLNFFLNSNQNCQICPKYQGEYFSFCEFKNNKRQPLLLNTMCLFKQITYHEIMYQLFDQLQIPFQINDLRFLQNCTLNYEKDLNIYLINNKDPFIVYKNKVKRINFCEIGYHDRYHCKVNKQNCLYQLNEYCQLCKQKYSLFKNKCIKCQQNCLLCQVQNKKIQCILLKDDFISDQKGRLQNCNDSNTILCQSSEQIIQHLRNQGQQICQHTQIYQEYNKKCIEISEYSRLYDVSKVRNIPAIFNQKLEIQYFMKFTSFNISQLQNQISMLINIQQMIKLSNMFENINRYDQDLFIQTQEDDQKLKIILDDITVYLGITPIIINYQGQAYLELLHIYDDKMKLQSEMVVQFNILIVFLHSKEQDNKNSQFESIILYENTNMTFIYNITFLQSPQLLFQNCFTLKLKANEIIFNGFKIYEYYETNHNCPYEYGIYAMAKIIKLSNLYFHRAKIIKCFYLYDFQFLEIEKVYFQDCEMTKFIKAFSYSSYNPISIIILNFNVINCMVHEILECINVNNIQFMNFTFIDTNFNQKELFNIFGNTENATISNFQFIGSNISQVDLFQLDSGYLKIQQIYLCDCRIKNSTIFFIKSHVQTIRFIYFTKVHIEYSEIFKYYGLQLTVQDFNLNISFIHFSTCFKLEIQYNIHLKNIYIHLKNSNYSLLFDSLCDSFFSSNLKFMSEKLIRTKFLNTKCNFAQIHHVLIGEYLQMLFMETQSIIDIRADKIIRISDVKLFNFKSTDSGFIYLLSNIQLELKNFLLINSKINIQYLQQLILIKICEQATLTNIQLRNINLKTEIYLFTLIYLFGREINYLTNISHIFAKTIQSDLPLILIQNEFSQIYLEQIYLKDLINISFISSNSTKFFLKNCWYKNIDNVDQRQAFISNQIQQDQSSIMLANINAKNFQGFFVSVQTINSSNIHLHNIQMKDSFKQKQQNTFCIIQQACSNTINNLLRISKISYENSHFIQEQTHLEYLFYIKFNIVIFDYIRINNNRQQFLILYHSVKLKVMNCYIVNFTSFNSVVEIADYQENPFIQNTFYIQLINITIKNSLLTLNSIIQMKLNRNQNVVVKNIFLVNIKAIKSCIIINNFQKLRFDLNKIIFHNITTKQLFTSEGSQLNLINCFILNSKMNLIFNNPQGNIIFQNSYIISSKNSCNLFKGQNMSVQSSEIVDSIIFSDRQNITLTKSYFQSGTSQNLMIHKFNEQQEQFLFLSLNDGQSNFKQFKVAKDIYQVQYSDNNSYLILPSGRDIYHYQYFDIKKQQYIQIYKSISIVNSNYYYEESISCILQQQINGFIVSQEEVQLKNEINILENITFTLNPLDKHKFIQFDIICLFNEHNITLRTFVKTFNCQLGEYLYQNQCLQCDIQRQYYSVGYNSKYCQINYQDKIKDLKVGQIKLFPNYWRYSYPNNQIELCDNQNCLGGWQTGDQSCQIGYIGALCKECDINNIRGNGNYGKTYDTCQICYFDNKIYIKGLCLVLWQLLLVYISYYSTRQQSQQHLFLKISQRKFKEILISLNVNQITILIQLFWNYLFTIYLLKDVLSFGYKIDVSLNFIYNPNLSTIPQQDCLTKNISELSIQYTQLLVKTVFPVFLFNILIIIYLVSVKITSRRFRIYVIIVSLISIYQQNQLIILQRYYIYLFSLLKLTSKVQYSKIWWTLESLAIQFYSKKHQNQLKTMIIPLITLFIICNIVACFWISFIHKKRYTYTQLSIFIYIQYKRSRFYWDYFRYIFIYAFMTFFYLLDDQQLIIIITLIILILSSTYKPFVLRNLNKIDQTIWQFSIFSFFSILVIQKEGSQLSLIILLISNLILIYLFIKQFLFSWNIQYKRSLVVIIQRIQIKLPILAQVISIDRYLKTQYYFQLLKQGRRKSECNLTSIVQTQSSYQQPANSCDIELIQLSHLQN